LGTGGSGAGSERAFSRGEWARTVQIAGRIVRKGETIDYCKKKK